MLWSNASFLEKLGLGEHAVTGIRKYQERLAGRGIDSSFADEIESITREASQLNQEQEGLKAQLKSKTAELERVLDKMRKKLSEAKKMIKVEIEPELWREFGIEDKK